jgi:peptide/nickel transport system substrate-binding protein
MEQMVVQFSLMANLTWSDGEALTAADSVFSYAIASALQPQSALNLLNRTHAYQAVNETTIEWRGLPGYRDRGYTDNYFSPLPEHQLANTPANALLTAEESAVNPTGWGAYSIDEVVPGERISLIKNENYFKVNEGLPYFDRLNIQFVDANAAGASIDALVSGECDLLDASINLEQQIDRLKELQRNGEILLFTATAGSWEHLDFGIVPVGYDDGYSQASGDRADFFGDLRVRQGIAQCIDREAIAEQFGYSLEAMLHSYVPSDHALFNGDVSSYAYDPIMGAGLLESAGWVMGESGIRVAQAIDGIADGTAFQISYFTTDSQQHQDIGQLIKDNLAACGIAVDLAAGAPEELFDGGPSGLLFGRQFDLGQFGWPLEIEPSCYLYLGEAIPGSDIAAFPYGWGGWNLTGWRNEEFDAACQAAQELLPGQEGYETNHLRAQEIFAAELPVIPLYAPQRVVATRADFCGLIFDSTTGALWNIEAFGYGQLCD